MSNCTNRWSASRVMEEMKKFTSARIGVDQGNTEVFSDFATGGKMWTETGPRERRKAVVFTEPFRTPPSVHVAVSMWDVDQGANLRVDISADNVSTTGFDLVFGTWSDTRVARVRMNWMAIGELPFDDDWELY